MIREFLYDKIGEYAALFSEYPNIVDKSDPSNREKLICKNMRIGVDIAVKAAVKYNLNNEETDDLISRGLLGVAVAYDKYQMGHSNIRTKVLDSLTDKMSGRKFKKLLESCCTYGKVDDFDLPLNRSYTRDELTQWLEAHTKVAKFSSVAWMWANAYVKEEIRNILNRRSTAGELEDDVPELKQRDQEKWELLFDNIGETDLYLLELRHGLAGERPMTFKEISKRTGFQIGVIRRACENALNLMKENANKYNIKFSDVFVG